MKTSDKYLNALIKSLEIVDFGELEIDVEDKTIRFYRIVDEASFKCFSIKISNYPFEDFGDWKLSVEDHTLDKLELTNCKHLKAVPRIYYPDDVVRFNIKEIEVNDCPGIKDK